MRSRRRRRDPSSTGHDPTDPARTTPIPAPPTWPRRLVRADQLEPGDVVLGDVVVERVEAAEPLVRRRWGRTTSIDRVRVVGVQLMTDDAVYWADELVLPSDELVEAADSAVAPGTGEDDMGTSDREDRDG